MTSPAEISRPPGFTAAGVVKIAASFGAGAADAAGLDGAERRYRLAQVLYQVPLAALVTVNSSGDGALQLADALSPKAGYYWSVRRLSCQGFSAGTVTVYKNGAVVGGTVQGTPEVLAPFPQAGVSTFGRSEGLLQPNDQLVIAASGITVATGYAGVQVNGTADCFPSWLLPDYIL